MKNTENFFFVQKCCKYPKVMSTCCNRMNLNASCLICIKLKVDYDTVIISHSATLFCDFFFTFTILLSSYFEKR